MMLIAAFIPSIPEIRTPRPALLTRVVEAMILVKNPG